MATKTKKSSVTTTGGYKTYDIPPEKEYTPSKFDLAKLGTYGEIPESQSPEGLKGVLPPQVADVINRLSPTYKAPEDRIQISSDQIKNLFGKEAGGYIDKGVQNAINTAYETAQRKPGSEEAFQEAAGTGSLAEALALERVGQKQKGEEITSAAQQKAREEQYRQDVIGALEKEQTRKFQEEQAGLDRAMQDRLARLSRGGGKAPKMDLFQKASKLASQEIEKLRSQKDALGRYREVTPEEIRRINEKYVSALAPDYIQSGAITPEQLRQYSDVYLPREQEVVKKEEKPKKWWEKARDLISINKSKPEEQVSREQAGVGAGMYTEGGRRGGRLTAVGRTNDGRIKLSDGSFVTQQQAQELGVLPTPTGFKTAGL